MKYKKSRYEKETCPALFAGEKTVAVEKVGLVYTRRNCAIVSTLIMLAVPATIAGCKRLLFVHRHKEWLVHFKLFICRKQTGITKIYKTGGAQAIAAMAMERNQLKSICDIRPGKSTHNLCKNAG
jgi:histidinol dehydrogenase